MLENTYIDEQIKKGETLIHDDKLDDALSLFEMIDKRSATKVQKAIISNEIGVIYKRKGLYKEAEKKYQYAIDVYEANGCEPVDEYILSLNNLSVLRTISGDYTSALKIYDYIKGLIENNIGENITYSINLNNIAALYLNMGHHEDAEALFLQSKKIREKIAGKGSKFYVQSIANLANFYKKWEKAETAITYYRDVLQLMESINFTNNPHYNKALINLCMLQIEKGNYNEAKKMLKNQFEHLNQLEKQHTIDYAKYLLEYSKLLKELKDFDSSKQSINEALKIVEQQAGTMNLVYTEMLSTKASLMIALKEYGAAYDLLLEAVRLQNEIFVNFSFGQSEGDALEFLRCINNEYNLLLSTVLNYFKDDSDKVRETYLNILLRKTIILEMTMVQNLRLGRYKDSEENGEGYIHEEMIKRLRDTDYAKILGRLRENNVFLDIFHLAQTDRYVMFALSKDKPVKLIDLGKASQLNRTLSKYRVSLTNTEQRKYHRLLSADLYRRFFGFLNGTLPEKLIISTANEISQLPFETIITPDQSYLIEKTMIQYISTLKDFEEETHTKLPKTLTLITDPNFDYPLNPSIIPDHEQSEQNGNKRLYKRLPASKVEGDKIRLILKDWEISEILEGDNATDLKVKQIPSSYILHIASHAVYRNNSTNNINPLKDSGIVLAGINSLIKGIALSEDEANEIEDGELNAYDMTFIDLKNTELVVLSACNTGLGKIVNGNGVIGLQRAVLLSGAKKLIMSLGEISDTASMLLMKNFYRKYRESLDVEKSLREAKLAIIRENIKKYGHAAPSRWGSYVCLSRSF
jgi:CHAT domain-containing protein